MKITVIGGSGFLGSRCVSALRALGGCTVEVAARRGPVRVDLGDPTTFENLLGVDAIVDLADTTRGRPDELAKFCLERGLMLIEATSDAPVMRRLYKAFNGKDYAGSLILGAGIFTGVSNLIARAAAERANNAKSVELGISSSPYSGAGKGTINLMVAALARAASRWKNGAREDLPPVARGPSLTFPSGTRPTLRMSFAEQEMLGPSLDVPSADVVFAPRPAFLVPAFLSMPGFMLRSSAFQWFMGGYFAILRRGLLRAKKSMVEMTAKAVGDKTIVVSAVAEDGMAAGGNAAAAIAHELASRKPSERPRGVRFVDQVVALGGIIELANRAAANVPFSRIEVTFG